MLISHELSVFESQIHTVQTKDRSSKYSLGPTPMLFFAGYIFQFTKPTILNMSSKRREKTPLQKCPSSSTNQRTIFYPMRTHHELQFLHSFITILCIYSEIPCPPFTTLVWTPRHRKYGHYYFNLWGPKYSQNITICLHSKKVTKYNHALITCKTENRGIKKITAK